MFGAVDAATPVAPTKVPRLVAKARAALAAAGRSCTAEDSTVMCRPAQNETTMNKVVSQRVIQACEKSLFKPSIRLGFHKCTHILRHDPAQGSFGLNGSSAHSKLGLVSAPFAKTDQLSQIHTASALERTGGRCLQGPHHGPRASVPPGTVCARPSGCTHERIQQVHTAFDVRADDAPSAWVIREELGRPRFLASMTNAD